MSKIANLTVFQTIDKNLGKENVFVMKKSSIAITSFKSKVLNSFFFTLVSWV